MGVQVYDQVLITGLSSSGTTDSLGTWTTGVDISSFVTLPTGASGVLLLMNNGTSAGSRWLGVRTTGKTTAQSLSSVSPQLYSHTWVPLNGSGQLDFYCQDATTAKFYILAVTDSSWVWNDIDAGFPTVSCSSSYTTRTLSVDAATTGVLLRGSTTAWAWRPVGTTSALTVNTGTEIVGLNGSYQFQNISSSTSTQEIIAEIRGGVTVNPTWPPTEETPVADGTWYDSTLTIPAGKALAAIRKTTVTNTSWWKWRKKGASFDPATSQIHGLSGIRHYAPVDGNGVFQYNVESASTGNQLVTLWLDGVSSASLSITSVTPSQIDSGESFTITGTGFGATQGLSLVQIGGVTQTPTSWSDTSITCTATRGSQSMGNATLTIYKM